MTAMPSPEELAQLARVYARANQADEVVQQALAYLEAAPHSMFATAKEQLDTAVLAAEDAGNEFIALAEQMTSKYPGIAQNATQIEELRAIGVLDAEAYEAKAAATIKMMRKLGDDHIAPDTDAEVQQRIQAQIEREDAEELRAARAKRRKTVLKAVLGWFALAVLALVVFLILRALGY